MIEFVDGTFNRLRTVAPWKMKTMIPYAAPSETRFRITAFRGRINDRNARVSKIVRSTTNSKT